jgi:hypothetical protein
MDKETLAVFIADDFTIGIPTAFNIPISLLTVISDGLVVVRKRRRPIEITFGLD